MPKRKSEDWWKKLASMWWEGETEIFPDNPSVEKYYRIKHSVAKRINPKRMAEIGVRAGYSAYAFVNACPDAEFVGLDNNSNHDGGVKGLFVEVAPKILSGFKAELVLFDSQQSNHLWGGAYDFIHIDGDHGYDACLHDLEISHKVCEWILVDDYDALPERVRPAVDAFKAAHPEYTYEYIEDGFRGNMLIHTTFRR